MQKKVKRRMQTTESLLEQIEDKKEVSPKQLSGYMKYLESSGGAAQYLLVRQKLSVFLIKTRSEACMA